MKRGERVSKRCVYGYKKGENNRLEIDPVSGNVVEEIFQLAASGTKTSGIIKTLYDKRYLVPSVYCGEKEYPEQPERAYMWTVGSINNILKTSNISEHM